MSIDLVYHEDDGGASPFDCRAVEIAERAQLRIACPYLSLDYLERLIGLAAKWRLVTDVAGWLATLATGKRPSTVSFILQNSAKIRDHLGLHAKVLIGDSSMMIGSANFTNNGMTRRTEFAVVLDDGDSVREITEWFDTLWTASSEIEPDPLTALAEELPAPPIDPERVAMTRFGTMRDAPLVTLEQPPRRSILPERIGILYWRSR